MKGHFLSLSVLKPPTSHIVLTRNRLYTEKDVVEYKTPFLFSFNMILEILVYKKKKRHKTEVE